MSYGWFWAAVSALTSCSLTLAIVAAFPGFAGRLLSKVVEQMGEARLARLRDKLGRDTSVHLETLKAELSRDVSAQVERLKAELQGAYSTLRASVDVLSASQTGLRSETIAAVQAMWRALLDYRREFDDLWTFHTILTGEEIARVFETSTPTKTVEMVERYRDEDRLMTRINQLTRPELEHGRLFVGEVLWARFYTLRSFHFRLAYLASASFKARKHIDWRQDELIEVTLRGTLSKGEQHAAKTEWDYGVQWIVSKLEADFLHEATRVMTGSRAFANSLADIQATLQVEHQRVAASRAALQARGR